MGLEVFIGYDAREAEAAQVAAKTLWETSRIVPRWLKTERLRDSGLLTRLTDRRANVIYDLISNAPASTDFAVSRFLPPILCFEGWALCTDCDVVFLRDVHELERIADERFAVMLVKHDHQPRSDVKMDGRAQLRYNRKNWSSVVLWNCSHPANLRLTLQDINSRPGIQLHQFYWLHDSEIGSLPGEWNWLVNEQPKPENLAIAHFTLGCPALPNWLPQPNDELWLRAAGRHER